MSGKILFFVFVAISSISNAQENPWLFPIKPGKINGISGSVGELRNTHFHTGVDIKTEGVEGLPVYASGDGYISRILVSPGGYGHALYIKHPNGYTTVYAHLQRFKPSIADWIRSEQYKNKTFALNRYPGKDQFPVKKGEVIGFSGNSGSSAGPHLHWDVRDPYQRPVNSMSIPFSEIRDNRPPLIRSVAFRAMDINSRVNGEFGRFEFPVIKRSDHYTLSVPVNLEGSIGIEVLAWDKLDDSYNNCGISKFVVRNAGTLKYQAHIEKLSFAKQSSIYSFYNYGERLTDGEKFTKLYIDDGNDLGFYEDSPGNGIIHFSAEEEKEVEIELSDSYGNTTLLRLENSPASNTTNGISWTPGFSKDGNTMRFVTFIADNQTDAQLRLVFQSGSVKVIEPIATGFHKAVYLYDLRLGIPTKAYVNDTEFAVPYKQSIPSGQTYTYFGDHINIDFGTESLFDTLYLAEEYQLDSTGIEIFSINNRLDPLKRRINITLKPDIKYDPEFNSVYSMDEDKNLYYEGGNWENGKISFRTQYFGDYTIAADTIPPAIKTIRADRDMLRFNISDNLSGIDDITATVNGEWVLMHYDPKYNLIFSEKRNKQATFSGELLLEITDQQGNLSTLKRTIE